jgi:flavin-dependent dehydrogenase
MDEALYNLAIKSGTTVHTETRVTDVQFLDDLFNVTIANRTVLTSKLVIGSYGKRETLDKELGRSFMTKRTRYMGVKYHIHTDYPPHEIGLDNFNGGYCGISKVDRDRYNLCYLYQRPAHSNYHSIDELQEDVLYQNPVLKRIFTESDFLFDKPIVINEIYFDQKTQIENHILMCGDTAGLITPLCGNGMSMAISAAQLLTSLILKSEILNGNGPDITLRKKLEQNYQLAWNSRFSKRLWWGRKLQSLFGKPLLTASALSCLSVAPALRRSLVMKTHGEILS